jgi:hypothetical protein
VYEVRGEIREGFGIPSNYVLMSVYRADVKASTNKSHITSPPLLRNSLRR